MLSSKFVHLKILVSLLICSGHCVLAQNTEEELRAAYIYNFAKYIRWPDEGPVFIIGMYGNDIEAANALQYTLKGKKIRGKEIQVKTIYTVGDAVACHILYCPDIENKKLVALVDATAGKSVLLVTKDDLIKRGAMISFFIEGENLKFKIKRDAVMRAGLFPSEGLLKLATVL